jgi:hypothetical protein
VSATRRDHDDIIGAQLHSLAAFAAEPHLDVSGGYPQHLAGGAVVVMVRIDPVAPGCALAVAG